MRKQTPFCYEKLVSYLRGKVVISSLVHNTTSPLFHGGNLHWASKKFGHPVEDWLDLSTGINPTPYPLPTLPDTIWQRLPDKLEEEALLIAARAYYQVPDHMGICAVPGTQSAIQRLPSLVAPSHVDILSPTYAEHLACWTRAGHKTREIQSIDQITDDTRILVVVNPNNPDGRILQQSAIEELTDSLHARNGTLILDEAFADTNPEISALPKLGRDNQIILKSFGKFFGLAGLRLGFVVGSIPIIEKLQRELGPWAVNGMAMEIGTHALQDIEWINDTRHNLAVASRRLQTLLQNAGLNVIGGTPLFRLIESPRSKQLFTHLCNDTILCRTFPDRPGFLRFGLPSTDSDWVCLEKSLGSWTQGS